MQGVRYVGGSTVTDTGIFLKCTSCGAYWPSRDAFLHDTNIQIIGYQPHFQSLETGYFYFTHATCGTTMLLPVGRFADLDDGPMFEKPLTGSDSCRGYCKHWRETATCDQECECAWVRRLMDRLQDIHDAA